jgi:hypothetical protein
LKNQFESNHVIFKPIDPFSLKDAELICTLRARQSGNFLRHTNEGIDEQIEYLKSYAERNKLNEEIYYKLWDRQRDTYNGVVRLTEIKQETKFNWESLVFSDDCSPMAPIDVMIAIYKIGFEVLGREKCGPWDVDKRHEKMMKIHEFCNMYSIEGEDAHYFHVAVNKEKYLAEINRFEKLGLGEIKWT